MGKKLLIIDDAMIIREMIKDAARADGWEIAGEASNGQEAIEEYRRLRPDAVTLDIVMPEFDGLHALKGIVQEDDSARVLVVSALDQTEVLKEALQHGARDFIVKPFDQNRLISALDKVAGNSQQPPARASAAQATSEEAVL